MKLNESFWDEVGDDVESVDTIDVPADEKRIWSLEIQVLVNRGILLKPSEGFGKTGTKRCSAFLDQIERIAKHCVENTLDIDIEGIGYGINMLHNEPGVNTENVMLFRREMRCEYPNVYVRQIFLNVYFDVSEISQKDDFGYRILNLLTATHKFLKLAYASHNIKNLELTLDLNLFLANEKDPSQEGSGYNHLEYHVTDVVPKEQYKTSDMADFMARIQGRLIRNLDEGFWFGHVIRKYAGDEYDNCGKYILSKLSDDHFYYNEFRHDDRIDPQKFNDIVRKFQLCYLYDANKRYKYEQKLTMEVIQKYGEYMRNTGYYLYITLNSYVENNSGYNIYLIFDKATEDNNILQLQLAQTFALDAADAYNERTFLHSVLKLFYDEPKEFIDTMHKIYWLGYAAAKK